VQSCAATMTSGASAAETVPRFDRIEPKSLVTTVTVAPFADAHWFAIFVTAGERFASVQMTIVGPALLALSADEATRPQITARTTAMPATRNVRILIPELLLGLAARSAEHETCFKMVKPRRQPSTLEGAGQGPFAAVSITRFHLFTNRPRR